jgi:Catalase
LIPDGSFVYRPCSRLMYDRTYEGERNNRTGSSVGSIPSAMTAMPRTFLDKMRALRPDPATGKPNREALAAFGASHPDNRGQAKFLADHNPPASYATSAYYGVHTFKFIDQAQKVTLVRWRFVPED